MKAKDGLWTHLVNPHFKVIIGLQDGRLAEQLKKPDEEFLYADHSYFNRGWEKGNFRLVRNGIHLTRVIPHRQQNRLLKFGVELLPFKGKRGPKIGFLRTSKTALAIHGLEEREEALIQKIRDSTDREIKFRCKGDNGTLAEFLSDCHCAVSLMTVAAVEAAIMGYPVYSTPLCPSWPIHAGDDIERPIIHDRYDWANSLAWSSWHWTDAISLDFKRYQT